MSPIRTLQDISRRDALYSMSSVVALAFLGCGGESSGSPTSPSSTTGSSSNASCIVTPALTEGPYFVDERLNRSDIRSDPTTGSVKSGVPLTLTVQLSQIGAGGTCTPLGGALVDMWHCDALGLYSDISPQNTVGQKFLRGYQLSDPAGVAQFVTIYPGWYMGRAVHIHFKVRTTPGSGSGLEFTSQMFFDESLTDIVHAQAPYSSKGRRDTTNSRDGIFQGGGSQLLLPLSASGGGYAGNFSIGVRV